MSQPPPPRPRPPEPPYGDAGGGSLSSLPPPQPPAESGDAWTVGQAVIGVVAVLVILNLGVLLVVPFTGTDGTDITLATQVLLALSLIGVAAWFASQRRSDQGPLRVLGIRQPASGWIGATLLAYLAYFVFAVLLGMLAAPEQTDVAEELGFDESTATALAAGFLIVVAAPLGEEIFFRGFFFAALREQLPFLVAAGISAVVFGAIHLTTSNWVAGLQLAGFGFALAWVYERTGSIVPCIALHLVNNSLAIAVAT